MRMARTKTTNKVLRVVYLDPKMYDFVYDTAKRTKQTFSVAFERLLVKGMKHHALDPAKQPV